MFNQDRCRTWAIAVRGPQKVPAPEALRRPLPSDSPAHFAFFSGFGGIQFYEVLRGGR